MEKHVGVLKGKHWFTFIYFFSISMFCLKEQLAFKKIIIQILINESLIKELKTKQLFRSVLRLLCSRGVLAVVEVLSE